MKQQGDILVIGLAVMGQNLMLNMNDHGYRPVAFNRTISKVDSFLQGPAKGTSILGAHSLQEAVSLLKSPRKIMLLVKAGPTVDEFIDQVVPHLAQGDILIDGGNANFRDTRRRAQFLAQKGILFVGTGVSGGEEGARSGPSLMPGGDERAWPELKGLFQSIAAKAPDGTPCCEWIGPDGAGHYVKTIHNGIEYGDMQLICEAYQLMKQGLGMNCQEMHQVFSEWNRGELESYLIEITAGILAYKDDDGSPLVEKILDTAGQKGTGKWTAISALELGVPVTLIAEAVYARCLSALKEERTLAARVLHTGSVASFSGSTERFIEALRKALLASKIVSYAQGFMLLREAAKEYNWQLDLGNISRIWRGGCVIRSVFLDRIADAFNRNPTLHNLILDEYFSSLVESSQGAWREVVKTAVDLAVPIPAFSSALSFYDGYRAARLPANLLQAQRDWFGTHTYERLDHPRGEFFHTNWSGRGGETSSTAYEA